MKQSSTKSVFLPKSIFEKAFFLTVFLLVTFFILPASLHGQQNNKLYKRVIVSKTEKWKPGKINDTRHVVDSFFYENGMPKEVAESIIKRKHFRVIDSIPVNERKFWSEDGHLLLREQFSEGRIMGIKSNYPPSVNMIQNGSFEMASEIPKHKITKINDPLIRCNPSASIIERDTIHVQFNEDGDETKFILFTKETVSNCDNDYSRALQKYVLIEKNRDIIDSVYVGMDNYIHEGNYARANKSHNCNYETMKIKVNNWESVGQLFPNVYGLKNSAPMHPLTGLAHSVFQFETVEGNNFVKLSAKQYSKVICNPWMAHPLLQNKLATTLRKGKKYHLEFRLWKPKIYPENRPLKVYFSCEPITINNYKDFSVDAITLLAFNDTTVHQWQKVSLTFEAPEYARYMTIGFFNFQKDNIPIPQDLRIRSWCYVDGFVLTEEPYKDKVQPNFYPDSVPEPIDFTVQNNKKSSAPIFFDQKIVEKDQSVALNNVNFHKDHYKLTEESIQRLNELIQLMKNNSRIHVEIFGHTDNDGTARYKQTLSDKRALSVVNYLEKNGVSRQRFSWKGFGDRHPASDHELAKGSALNRRVEFVIKDINE